MSVSSKDLILGRIRKNLGRGELARDAVKTCSDRVANPTPNLIPARAQKPQIERIELFKFMAEQLAATVAQVGSMDEVPGAVASFLKDHNQPASIVRAPDPSLDTLPWEGTTLEVRTGRAERHDHTSVTPAFAGIAETGTVALTSGPETPYTLNMLPDNHIVVLPVSQVVGAYEEMWSMLRKTRGQGSMPRTVLWASGPSRTGDIEQTILLGAHGPRRLHIVLVDDIEGTA